MITVRRSDERGHFDHGWLDTYHSFSFASYYDPKHMGFRSLRVINEDRVAPGDGFGTHPHRDMEIITYVLQGGLSHKDSMGNGSTIRPGDVQRMSAGTGVLHSEFNHSKDEAVHLLQIWILPDKEGVTPSYEQKFFDAESKRGVLRLIASRDGRDGSVTIHQDADLFASVLDKGARVEHLLPAGRSAWLQAVSGKVAVNGIELSAGDGAAVSAESTLTVEGSANGSEILLFDLD